MTNLFAILVGCANQILVGFRRRVGVWQDEAFSYANNKIAKEKKLNLYIMKNKKQKIEKGKWRSNHEQELDKATEAMRKDLFDHLKKKGYTDQEANNMIEEFA